MNDAATTATSIQSRFCISDERTDGGSCGRGCTGGGVTNWKSTVTSPMTTLPRDRSGSSRCHSSPFFCALPWRSAGSATT